MKNNKENISNLWMWVFRSQVLNSKNKEKGNTLIIAISLGLVILAATTTGIFMASKNKTNVYSEESAKQNVAITEAGINNLIAQFNANSQNRELLIRTFDPNGLLGTALNEWTDTTKDLTLQYAINSCGSSADDVANNLTVITVDSTTGSVTRNRVSTGTGSSAGVFELLAYRYDEPNNLGRLLVQGELNRQSNSRSRLLVEFPVTIEPVGGGGSGPALMASDFNMRQSDAITTNVVCTDPAQCQLSCSGGATQPSTNDLRDSLGATTNSVINNPYQGQTTDIKIGSLSIPAVPPPPSGVTINTFTSPGDITQNSHPTLPRSGDVVSNVDVDGKTKQVYYYQIRDWDRSRILINTNAEVRIYISGNVTQSGNDDLRLVDATATPRPGQIRVYGNPPSNSTQNWLLSGNACTMAFIHAPYANVGIDGGGNGCSGLDVNDAVRDANLIAGSGTYTASNFNSPGGTNIYGGVWAKSYNVIGNPSNSSVFFEQPGLMEVIGSGIGGFPGFQAVKSGSLTSWQKQPVN
ncbi:DUF7305 domain-containing protein [Geminocystis sp. CENA526]|uniref:DUF7305 domain-containing protein n=1 Tax=Geminocystis sp. CENA526 TaxID=1355871 RepID=UPI003D6FAF5E